MIHAIPLNRFCKAEYIVETVIMRASGLLLLNDGSRETMESLNRSFWVDSILCTSMYSHA